MSSPADIQSNSNTPLVSRPVVTQEWSLHAELTFSHDGFVSTAPLRQQSSDSGVNTSCSWANPGVSTSARHPCYGFQRGNILFTTTPPSRNTQPSQATLHQASGVASVSHCDTTPCRSPQPYNRRCKSTCNIILSGVQEPSNAKLLGLPRDRGTSCSPVPRCYHTLTHHCGDPVCYHANCVVENVSKETHTVPVSSSVPDIDEACEVCGGGRSPTALRRAARTNTFTTHFCTRVPERAHSFGNTDSKQMVNFVKTSKDAAIQTSEPVQNNVDSKIKVFKNAEDTNCLQVPDIEFLESSGKKKPGKKLSRSPARLQGKSPLMQSRQNSLSGSNASSPEMISHKPRTVHIDVYCTGSEDADADASNTSDTNEEGESWSSPQTVFESEDLRVVHSKAGKNQLPHALQAQRSSKCKNPGLSYHSDSFKCSQSEKKQQYLQGFDSDDGLSSHYPSKQSSYTTFQDSELSLLSDVQTTFTEPSSTISSTSCALFNEEYDSMAATSWKDTTTEFDSIVMSNLSLALSDSFEYADAMDRLRIREKEKSWACSPDKDESNLDKTWQSSNSEQKHLLQQQKFKEYLKKHHGEGFPLWKPCTTEDTEDDDEDDDETGDAWVFSGRGGSHSEKCNTLKRDCTVRKATVGVCSDLRKFSCDQVNEDSKSHFLVDSGSLSDSGTIKHRLVRRSVIGPFGVRPPSPPPSKLESTVMSPFTAVGRGTGHLYKAQKFGTIIGAFRKPGHHVGPAKNPDCTCQHCQYHYKKFGHRGRARSVGDMPCIDILEWKT